MNNLLEISPFTDIWLTLNANSSGFLFFYCQTLEHFFFVEIFISFTDFFLFWLLRVNGVSLKTSTQAAEGAGPVSGRSWE